MYKIMWMFSIKYKDGEKEKNRLTKKKSPQLNHKYNYSKACCTTRVSYHAWNIEVWNNLSSFLYFSFIKKNRKFFFYFLFLFTPS